MSDTPKPKLAKDKEKNNDIEQKQEIEGKKEDRKDGALEEKEFDEENEYGTYEAEEFEYEADKINVSLWQPTIFQILRRINQKTLDLAPKFQRYANIWTDGAKSRLIESILIRIPLPAFYIDRTDERNWEIVDGLQRITTFKQFCENQFKLKDLEYLTELKDKKFDELDLVYQSRIEDNQLIVYSIDRGTPHHVRYNIFHRINTGGEPLTSQEIRHVVNSSGKAPEFLEKLSQNKDFQETTNISNYHKKRMQDREFILQFLAFKITKYTEYEPGLRNFLDEAMFKLNQHENLFESLEEQFEKAMKAANNIFGLYAFRKRLEIDEILRGHKPKYENRPNKALFEVWAVSLSNLQHPEIEKLQQQRQVLINNFNKKLMGRNRKFDRSISQLRSQKEEGVIYRFRTIERLIKEVLR